MNETLNKLHREGGWIGVDLDGVIAEYHEWTEEIGKPIPAMIMRIQRWLSEGKDVRVFTARIAPIGENSRDEFYVHRTRKRIQDYCYKHIGQILPITNEKDCYMIELWDDRCVQMVPNTGRTISEDYEAKIKTIQRIKV